MSTGSLSLVTFAILLLLNAVVPLGISIVAARSNFRHRRSNRDERKFWVAIFGYLLISVLLSFGDYELRIHPEPEGYVAFIVIFLLVLSTIPGSIVSVIVTVLVAGLLYAEPVLLPSFTVWFLVGVLCWAVFNATGLRWLIQSRRRARLPAAAARGESQSRVRDPKTQAPRAADPDWELPGRGA